MLCVYCIYWTPLQAIQGETQKHTSLFIGKREVWEIDKFKGMIKTFFVTMSGSKGGKRQETRFLHPANS